MGCDHGDQSADSGGFKTRFSSGSLSTSLITEHRWATVWDNRAWNATQVQRSKDSSAREKLFTRTGPIQSRNSAHYLTLTRSTFGRSASPRSPGPAPPGQRMISKGPLITMPTMRPREGTAYPPRQNKPHLTSPPSVGPILYMADRVCFAYRRLCVDSRRLLMSNAEG
jgi:hypothetical protein